MRTTRNLVAALAPGDRRQLFCSTSAVGYYGPRGDEELTEDAQPDVGFLGELSRLWESEALKAQDLGVRVVVTRFGIVLGRGGGALGQMVPVFKKFLGGPIGSGDQWFSWIHQADHARAFRFIQENPQISGPVNFTAPHPVRNRELAKALGQALHRPSFMPTPGNSCCAWYWGNLPTPCSPGSRFCPNACWTQASTSIFPTIETALADLLGNGTTA